LKKVILNSFLYYKLELYINYNEKIDVYFSDEDQLKKWLQVLNHYKYF